MAAGPWTAPSSKPTWAWPATPKRATTVLSAPAVSVQVAAMPLQSPAQPKKTLPAAGRGGEDHRLGPVDAGLAGGAAGAPGAVDPGVGVLGRGDGVVDRHRGGAAVDAADVGGDVAADRRGEEVDVVVLALHAFGGAAAGGGRAAHAAAGGDRTDHRQGQRETTHVDSLSCGSRLRAREEVRSPGCPPRRSRGVTVVSMCCGGDQEQRAYQRAPDSLTVSGGAAPSASIRRSWVATPGAGR